MPVTRDLSPAKRNMIVKWLNTTGNAGQPNLGSAPHAAVAAGPQIAAAREFRVPPVDTGRSGKSGAVRKKVGASPEAAFQKD